MNPSLALTILILLSSFPSPLHAAPLEITQIPLKYSNAFVLRPQAPARPILVDTGTPKDGERIDEALQKLGLKPQDLALIVLTHAHADHAGLAADFRRRSGAKIAMGKADTPLSLQGHNDELKPTSLMGYLLKPFVGFYYETFEPDLPVESPVDLAPWGVDGTLVQMPGHTPGSLVLKLRDGRALVGDMMLGGYFGGRVLSGSPGEHYFHADRAANRANIQTLLASGTREFLLGHGGPVLAEDVQKTFGQGK